MINPKSTKTFIMITAFDQSGNAEDTVEVVETIDEGDFEKIKAFVKELNNALEDSSDPSILWRVEETHVPLLSADGIAEHIHMSDGTNSKDIDEIYRSLIRKHFNPIYDGSTLPEE